MKKHYYFQKLYFNFINFRGFIITHEDIELFEDSASEIVPLKEKLAYGFADMPGTFYGSIMGVIQSFYFAWMGLLNVWILAAQIIYAIWNVLNDPWFGNKIGNTRYLNKKN